MPPDSNDDDAPSRQAQMTAPAPLSKDELKAVTLSLRNASDLCEVVDYIGELTLLEASCLGKRLVLVKEWLSRIEMLAGWRGELEVDMELFAADVELVLEACQQRGKLSFEKYVAWFAQSGFQTMPRYKGRFRRLFKALEKLRNYTRMVYREIPDRTPSSPPPAPKPVAPQPENSSTIVEAAEEETLAAAAADDVAAIVEGPSEQIEEEEKEVAPQPLSLKEFNDMHKYYLPREKYRRDGLPSECSVLDKEDFDRLSHANKLYQQSSTMIRAGVEGGLAEAAASMEEASDAIQQVYSQSLPDHGLSYFYYCCLHQLAGIYARQGRIGQAGEVAEAAALIAREASERDPYDLLVLKALAYTLIDQLVLKLHSELPHYQTIAEEALQVFRKLDRIVDYFGAPEKAGLDAEEQENRHMQVLIFYGLAVYPTQPTAAVTAWEEAVHSRLAEEIKVSPAPTQHIVFLWAKAQLCLASAYEEQGEDLKGLRTALEGLQVLKQVAFDAAHAPHVKSLRAQYLPVCRTLLPREEKRLIKLVNIRKIQAKTRKQIGQAATEEQKAELAAAVAELAELRELQRALKEGSL